MRSFVTAKRKIQHHVQDQVRLSSSAVCSRRGGWSESIARGWISSRSWRQPPPAEYPHTRHHAPAHPAASPHPQPLTEADFVLKEFRQAQEFGCKPRMHRQTFLVWRNQSRAATPDGESRSARALLACSCEKCGQPRSEEHTSELQSP